MYPEAEQSSLKVLIQKFHPHRILSVGPAGQEIFADYLQQNSEVDFDNYVNVGSVPKLEQIVQYDVCLVSHVLEYLPKLDAEHLVARLRDVHCGKLIVVIPTGDDWPGLTSTWQPNELLGLGFSRIGEFQHQGRQVHIYAFDIGNYKTTPEWLNSKYWANPELFDKYWW